MPKRKPKPRSERAIKAARRRRIKCLRAARVIIAFAAADDARNGLLNPGGVVERSRWPSAPSYYGIASKLGLPRAVADVADEIYNDVNGPDDWTPKCEELAMERLQTLLEGELEDDEA